MTVQYDADFVQKIALRAKRAGLPAGTLGERNKALDHGTMVPLYFINQKHTHYRLVRVSLSGLSFLAHYQLGKLIGDLAAESDEPIVYIASGDLSHKLTEDGPYGFSPEGPVFDSALVKAMENADFMRFMTFREEQCEHAAECGLRSFILMAGALDGKRISSRLLSYEGPFGVGYAVASYQVEGVDDTRHFDQILMAQEADILRQRKATEDSYVQLARKALETYVQSQMTLEAPLDLPEEMTRARAGVFVSLKLNQRLRGCIGTIMPTRDSIAEEIIQNAISAGCQDPRFDPVNTTELSGLIYSVDVLMPPERVPSKTALDPKKYGVIVSTANRRGLLLPDLEGIDTVDEQLRIALRKAGIRDTEPYTIERFEVIRHD
jgi:AmmeMemoRadiSam system protein A